MMTSFAGIQKIMTVLICWWYPQMSFGSQISMFLICEHYILAIYKSHLMCSSPDAYFVCIIIMSFFKV